MFRFSQPEQQQKNHPPCCRVTGFECQLKQDQKEVVEGLMKNFPSDVSPTHVVYPACSPPSGNRTNYPTNIIYVSFPHTVDGSKQAIKLADHINAHKYKSGDHILVAEARNLISEKSEKMSSAPAKAAFAPSKAASLAPAKAAMDPARTFAATARPKMTSTTIFRSSTQTTETKTTSSIIPNLNLLSHMEISLFGKDFQQELYLLARVQQLDKHLNGYETFGTLAARIEAHSDFLANAFQQMEMAAPRN